VQYTSFIIKEDISSLHIDIDFVCFAEALTQVSSMKNYKDITASLRVLTAYGGGDCPEFAMSGILKGILHKH